MRRLHNRKPKPPPKQRRFFINDQITATELRVIDDKNENLGVMTVASAKQLARERNLDLVQIAQTPRETIAKVISFSKFKYQQEKQDRKHRVDEKKNDPKTVRIGFASQRHDLEIRSKQADEFLTQGYPVQVEMNLRGRQKAHADIAQQNARDFLTFISVGHKVIQEKRTPRGFMILIAKH
jgi:translation initiation factor IF-3